MHTTFPFVYFHLYVQLKWPRPFVRRNQIKDPFAQKETTKQTGNAATQSRTAQSLNLIQIWDLVYMHVV